MGMSDPVNIYDAKTRFSELVERAAGGEEIIIARAGTPVARLVPVRVSERKPGEWKGKVRMSEDFDELPEDYLRETLAEPLEP